MHDYIPREIDINETMDTIVVKQFDNISRFLHIQITDETDDGSSVGLNLVDCEARLYVEPDFGQITVDNIAYVDGEILDGDNGVVAFFLPNGITQETGMYSCEIWLTNSTDGSTLSTKPFKMVVEKSIRKNEVIEMTGQFSALDNALKTVGEFDKRISNLTIPVNRLSNDLQRPSNVISAGTVMEMIKNAETYFNYAYTGEGEESKILYESNKGLYSSDIGTNSAKGQYGIVCSSFVEAILNAIPFEYSRYQASSNTRLEYGVDFDDTGDFGKTIGSWSTQADIDAHNYEATNRYLTSGNLAKYAAEHNYLYMIDGKQNIRAGDVLFYRNKAHYPATADAHIPSQDSYYPYPTDDYKPYAFMGIDHVAVVINTRGNYVTVMEGWPSTKVDFDGTTHDVGIRVSYNDLITGRGDQVCVCGATFPMGDVANEPVLNQVHYDMSGNTSSSSLVLSLGTLKKGFYTVVAHGSNLSTPYISMPYDSHGSKQAYLQKAGNSAYQTFYVERDIGVTFRIPTGNEYAFSEVALYRGYCDITHYCETELIVRNRHTTNTNQLVTDGTYGRLSFWTTKNNVVEYCLSGKKSNAPTTLLPVGCRYFCTDLSKPIFWTGSKWVYADGTDA